VSKSHQPSRRASTATATTRRDSGQTSSEITIRGIPPTLNELPRFSIISLASDSDAMSPIKKFG
jgi:hypothetical protein